jgi:hypothetical protein
MSAPLVIVSALALDVPARRIDLGGVSLSLGSCAACRQTTKAGAT